MPPPSPCEPSLLDPVDWEDFRRQARQVLDACVDYLAAARDHPWRPVGEAVRAALALGEAAEGTGLEALSADLVELVLPYASGNIQPRFFGWVHGTGLAAGLLAEMVAATMNSNCGGRDHGAVYVERAVIDWCRRVFGLPAGASGVLVSGTSQATVIALAAARQAVLGDDCRREGVYGAPRLAAYAVEGVHKAVVKALELLGLGGAALRRIAARPDTGAMDLEALARALAEDRAAGVRPLCVIGTAGSVDRGDFDDLEALADVCAREQIWFHVDGAFGAWLRLADAPWRELARGLERADSLAFDFHKWMYVQYDCGAVLIRDEARHRAAFATRPAYLAPQSRGLGGGDPWFCDYGVDLSRGFRALKVWSALRAHGSGLLGEAITRNCRLAALMARLVEAAPQLTLSAPVRSNVCCFSAAPPDLEPAARDAVNARIAQELQLAGEAVFSTTSVHGRTVLRAAIVNHRTCEADVETALAAVRRTLADLTAAPAGDRDPPRP
jgi:glutamate/tyrosine decarboxylase-like PLP-dependent enzyme